MKYSEFIPIDLARASDQQLALVNAHFDKSAPEVWRDFAELNFVFLRFNATFKDMPDQLLADAAVGLVCQCSSSFGGQQFYFPRGLALLSRERSALILKEFRGNNFRELAIKHRVTDSRIRQIVQEQADLKKAEQRQNGGK